MKRKYLGDSYDVVKRMWRELFEPWAPLLAESRFVPNELQEDFTRLTGIRMLHPSPEGQYSIFNDPDTGIRAPLGKVQSESTSHILLTTISEQCAHPGVQCVVTYDQSNHRVAGFGPQEQRMAKMQCLSQKGIPAFYYVSHAPFLFASSSENPLNYALGLIQDAGIPSWRLERAP